jgi:hypothetical protein
MISALAPHILTVQILAVLSFDTDDTLLPSGLHATDLSGLAWPSSPLRRCPVKASQIVPVASAEAVATMLVVGLQTIDITLSVWP